LLAYLLVDLLHNITYVNQVQEIDGNAIEAFSFSVIMVLEKEFKNAEFLAQLNFVFINAFSVGFLKSVMTFR
jgi:hypothetical protein